MIAGLPRMKNVLTSLISLRVSVRVSAADAAIQKKIHWSGITTLISSNEEMEDIIKIDKSLQESGLLIKGFNEIIKNETKEQKGGFLSILLGTLAARLFGNALKVKPEEQERTHLEQARIFNAPYPLTNFKIQKYYQNETKFNGAYSRNNLSKINDGTCIINLDEYESIETHSIALYVNAENVTYLDSFEVEYIPKKLQNSLEIKIL